MNTTYPLDTIIESIITTKNITRNQVTCDDIKNELTNSLNEDGSRVYNINYKEDPDNDLILFFYNEQHENLINNNPPKTSVTEDACKSCIYTRSTLEYVASQFNRIIYNDDALELLQPNLENAIIQKCYEGTTLLVFYHNNKWFISTRKCIDASSSSWVRNQSYKDLFEEAIDRESSIYDILDHNYYYVFILVHYKNKNIVNYNQPYKHQNRFYKKLYLSNVCIKGTYNEIQRDAYHLPNISWTEEINFNNVDTLLIKLKECSDQDISEKSISTEGFVLKIYPNEEKQGKFIIGKLQTAIYKYIMAYKPNVQNVYQIYLEFYKQDKLSELLPYFYKGKNTITLKIHNSMKIITKEMLELYHMTRNKRNEELYSLMPKIYKKVLYDLHGIYIKNKKEDLNSDQKDGRVPIWDQEEMNRLNKSINIHDVYSFLKTMPLKQVIKIFQEREKLIETGNIKCLNNKDMDVAIYTKLLLD